MVMSPEIKTTRNLRGATNTVIALAGIAAAAYGIHNGAFSNSAHARFDAMHDGVFHTQPQYPNISDMILINGHSANDLLNAAMPQGADQALVFGGAALGAVSTIKAGADFTPMTDKTRLRINVAANLALLLGGAAAFYAALQNGGLHGTRFFDNTNDGVFHDPRFPGIGNMVLINGNTSESVFNAAKMTGFAQELFPVAIALSSVPALEALPESIARRRKPSIEE